MSTNSQNQLRDHFRFPGKPAAGCMVLVLALIITSVWPPAPGWSQTIQGEPHDLIFKILNATTGGPGTIERLEINYQGTLGGKLLDERPSESEITLRNVPIKPAGHYVITAWAGGVPYFWDLRGDTMIDQVITLHIFDTSESLADVQISGMNILFRLQESIVKIEYMITANNTASPQVTITGRPVTLDISIPPGTTDISAVYLRGPDPIPVEVHSSGLNRIGLAVPLTSGLTQIKVEAMATWNEEIDYSLVTNVPVTAWSLLTSPESLRAESFELDPDVDNVIPGFRRLIGPPLQSDQGFRLHLVQSGAAAPLEEVFTQNDTEAPDGAPATGPDAGGMSGMIPIVVGLGVLAIVILIVVGRRR